MRHNISSWYQELLSIFISGGLPIFIAYLAGGSELVETLVKGLLINDWLMYYTAICSLAAIFLSYLIYRFNFSNRNLQSRFYFTSAALLDSFGTFVSIFKVTGGLFCSISILWLAFDFEIQYIWKISFLASVGIVSAACGYHLNKLHYYAKTKWLKQHLEQSRY